MAAAPLRGCWPWQLVVGLLYCALARLRVLETIDARPVRGDREQMLRYCSEVRDRGFSVEDGGRRRQWQLQMLKEAAPQRALEAMEDFPEDSAIHSACIRALCAVALFNAGTERSLLEMGALRSVLVSGLGFVRDPDVTGAAAASLGCLADEHRDARLSLARMGGPQFAADTWDRYPDKPNVLFGACALVAAMCYDYPDAKRLTMKVGFVQRALQGIRDFPNSGDRVREEVMQAFNALSGRPALGWAQASMMQLGALEGVLTVLRENNDDMTTLTNANRVVHNFAMQNESYRAAMAEAGVPELLARQLGAFDASKAWASYVDVDVSAVTALLEMIKGGREEEGVKRQLLRAGVLEKVQEAMKKRPRHELLAKLGNSLMNKLKSVEMQT